MAPHPGIEPALSTLLEGEVLTTGSPGKSHESNYLKCWLKHTLAGGMLQDGEFN